MKKFVDEDGHVTHLFIEATADMVKSVLDRRSRGVPIGDLFVPAVKHKGGKISYWGIIDFEELPEEDIYVEVRRRFYGACLALENDFQEILEIGMVNVGMVINKIPPFPPKTTT